MYTKYPRTPHLPWSPGKSGDDRIIEAITSLSQLEDILVTEKLDGENTTLYRDHLHSRSLDYQSHPSRDWVKRLYAQIRSDVPENFRICGENVFAKHSIFYKSLTTYYFVFAIFQEDICLSWSETLEWCQLLGLETVPVLYRGKWDEAAIKSCWRGISVFGDEQEGYVVRNADKFQLLDFQENVAKYVRAQHVKTSQHWLSEALIPNQLK
jgi:hypothetical protein